MPVGDEVLLPEPSELAGLAFFGETAEAAERMALAYSGAGASAN